GSNVRATRGTLLEWRPEPVERLFAPALQHAVSAQNSGADKEDSSAGSGPYKLAILGCLNEFAVSLNYRPGFVLEPCEPEVCFLLFAGRAFVVFESDGEVGLADCAGVDFCM